MVILNRNSPDTYSIELSRDFQLQHKDPYLIFKQQSSGGETNIRGIWFPNPNERILMDELLNQVLTVLKQSVLPPPAPAPAPQLPAVATTATSIPGSADQGAAIAALLSPLALAATTPSATTSSITKNATPVRQASPSQQSSQPTLDKKSLQLALLSLIQDERFLDLLHAQYLKVAHARKQMLPTFCPS